MRVSNALVVGKPWISLILEGLKTWEMRSKRTSIRGPVALIQKGSGNVVGVAELVGVRGPLTDDEMEAHEVNHRIPPKIYRAPEYKWYYAWVLENAMVLPSAVPYKHKNGAVIWVQLDEQTQQGIAEQLTEMDWPLEGSPIQARAPLHGDSEEDLVTQAGQSGNDADSLLKLPMAKDGSLFCRDTCQRGGRYTVGEKGWEVSFQNFEAALDHLREMPVAKWRRPNDKGNWGVVAAVSWVELDQVEGGSFKSSHDSTGLS